MKLAATAIVRGTGARMADRSPREIRTRYCRNASSLVLLFAFAQAVQAQAIDVPAPVTRPATALATFQVDDVRVEGNTLLAASAVEAALAGVAGPGRTLGDLNQAASRLQRAYREAGYGGVLAFVPQQTLDGGTVLIRVVEGRLAEVRISGNQHFSSDNIRAGLPGWIQVRCRSLRAAGLEIIVPHLRQKSSA